MEMSQKAKAHASMASAELAAARHRGCFDPVVIAICDNENEANHAFASLLGLVVMKDTTFYDWVTKERFLELVEQTGAPPEKMWEIRRLIAGPTPFLFAAQPSSFLLIPFEGFLRDLMEMI